MWYVGGLPAPSPGLYRSKKKRRADLALKVNVLHQVERERRCRVNGKFMGN